MNLIKEERGAALIIRVVGQLTVTDRAELETMVGHAIDAGQRRIVLDFSATPYIDSSGLAALAAMARRRRRAARRCAGRRPSRLDGTHQARRDPPTGRHDRRGCGATLTCLQPSAGSASTS
jgi:anti-anti-sigma factor